MCLTSARYDWGLTGWCTVPHYRAVYWRRLRSTRPYTYISQAYILQIDNSYLNKCPWHYPLIKSPVTKCFISTCHIKGFASLRGLNDQYNCLFMVLGITALLPGIKGCLRLTKDTLWAVTTLCPGAGTRTKKYTFCCGWGPRIRCTLSLQSAQQRQTQRSVQASLNCKGEVRPLSIETSVQSWL